MIKDVLNNTNFQIWLEPLMPFTLCVLLLLFLLLLWLFFCCCIVAFVGGGSSLLHTYKMTNVHFSSEVIKYRHNLTYFSSIYIGSSSSSSFFYYFQSNFIVFNAEFKLQSLQICLPSSTFGWMTRWQFNDNDVILISSLIEYISSIWME